jgi:hypothetical protein
MALLICGDKAFGGSSAFDGLILSHIQHSFTVASSAADVYELKCERCGSVIAKGGLGGVSRAALSTHLGHKIHDDGAQLVCAIDGRVVAEVA